MPTLQFSYYSLLMTTSKNILFPKLNEAQIAEIEKRAELKSFSDGEILYKTGTKNFNCYVVKSGEIEIVNRADGEAKIVTTARVGQFTGDVALLTGNASVIDAIAVGDCQVLEITNTNLRKLLQENSPISDIFVQAFIARKKRLDELPGFTGIRVIGSRFSSDTFRIRNFLAKNRVWFTWVDLENEPQIDALLEQLEIAVEDTPVVTNGDLWLRKNPSNGEIAELLGIKTPLKDTVYDLAIVGAGPAGLAAAVYGASEGLNTVVLEKTAPGGQAGSSSKIENYMGFPTGISGTELANRAYLQAQKFGVQFSIPVEVVGLKSENSYHRLLLAGGEEVVSRSVLIATGVEYRKLNIEGYEQFESKGIYYSATTVEAQLCRMSQVVVVGGGNSAGQAAIFLSETASKVLLLIRGDDLSKSMSKYLVQRIEKKDNIELLTHTEINKMMGDDILHSVELLNNQTQETRTVEAAAVFIFVGAKPYTASLSEEIELDEDGFIKTGTEVAESSNWIARRQPFLLETSCMGVFAAGDVRSDSIKRVASSVGEGSMTVKLVHQLLSM